MLNINNSNLNNGKSSVGCNISNMGQLCVELASCCFPARHPAPQEKNSLEIDLNYKLKTLQQRLEQEQTEHRGTRAQLTDKYESIEEAKSAAMNGMPVLCQSMSYSAVFHSAFSVWFMFLFFFFPGTLYLCLLTFLICIVSPPLVYLTSSSHHQPLPAFLQSHQTHLQGLFRWEEFLGV